MFVQEKATIYSVNEGNHKAFPDGVKRFIDDVHSGAVGDPGLRV